MPEAVNPEAPRIAYLITSSGMGGAERQVHDLARSFRRRGSAVLAVSMLPVEEAFDGLRDQGVELATLGMRKGVPDPRAVARLARLLRGWRPDVIHAHMVHANLLARASRCLIPGAKVVCTLHNQDEGSQWRYRAYHLTDRFSDLTSTVSSLALAEAVRRGAAPPNRIILVPNGVDIHDYGQDADVGSAMRAELGIDDSFLWLAVGRLVDAKDYPNMIAAFASAASAHPTARLVIAGVGPLEGRIRSLVASAGLGDRVRLLGLRSDVARLMKAADGFVMSSAWEGLPMVLLEAAASALPVVATDVGGSADAVREGSSGYLVPPGDPDALASALRRVMELSRDERRALGASGRVHVVERFELSHIADVWSGLYDGLLHRSDGGHP